MSTNWREARLSDADYAMLEFTEKLTLLPCDMKQADAAGLRQHGFTDREILSIALAAAYRNFITRVADALGVELRRGEDYTPEILNAFGVTQEEAQTTMYGKRQVAEPLVAETVRRAAQHSESKSEAGGVCWLEAPSEATQEARDAIAAGFPRNLARALSLRPESLRATLGFGRLAGMGGSGLGRRIESVIGLTVAASLQVPYMAAHHAQKFREAGAGDGEVRALAALGTAAHGGFDAKERAVARFCEKLTRLPCPMARSDLEAVRACGFDDRDLLTIVACAAFENFLGRVAAGVGARLERQAGGAAAKIQSAGPSLRSG